jgi:hypothetical protein
LTTRIRVESPIRVSGFAYQLGQDGAPQRLSKKHRSLRWATVQRGRPQTDHFGELGAREQTGYVPQKGALGLHAPKLLEECEGEHLRARESLKGLGALALRVDAGVGVLEEVEKDDEHLFRSGELSGILGRGPSSATCVRSRMAFFYFQTTQHSTSTSITVAHGTIDFGALAGIGESFETLTASEPLHMMLTFI